MIRSAPGDAFEHLRRDDITDASRRAAQFDLCWRQPFHASLDQHVQPSLGAMSMAAAAICMVMGEVTQLLDEQWIAACIAADLRRDEFVRAGQQVSNRLLGL